MGTGRGARTDPLDCHGVCLSRTGPELRGCARCPGDDYVNLSVGTYCIPAGGLDSQSPHTEDELYVVTAGRPRIVTPDGAAEVGPGSVIFVPAAEEHRFEDVSEDLALIVVFVAVMPDSWVA
jgi:quercetin dioxygenase-like cupin family protein